MHSLRRWRRPSICPLGTCASFTLYILMKNSLQTQGKNANSAYFFFCFYSLIFLCGSLLRNTMGPTMDYSRLHTYTICIYFFSFISPAQCCVVLCCLLLLSILASLAIRVWRLVRCCCVDTIASALITISFCVCVRSPIYSLLPSVL